MKLRTKILCTFLPVVVGAVLGLGFWSIHIAKTALDETFTVYMGITLSSFVENEISKRQDILEQYDLQTTPSYVEQFQMEVSAKARNSQDALKKTYATANLFAVTPEGELAMHGFSDEKDRLASEDWSALVALFREDLTATYYHVEIAGQLRHMTVTYFEPWKWFIILSIDDAEINQSSEAIRQITFLVAAVVSLLCLLLTFFILNRSVMIPLQALKEITAAIANRRRPVGQHSFANDELGELAKEIESVATSLAHYEKQQKDWKEDLEGEVEARTVELTKSNKQLVASEWMLKSVLDTIPVSVFWKDTELKYIGCNTKFAIDAGLRSPEDVKGKDDFILAWGKAQAEAFRNDDLEVIQSGKAKLLFQEPQTRMGDIITWLETSKVPLRNEDGTITGVLGTYVDITERKKAAEVIRMSEERLSALFQLGQQEWSSEPKLIDHSLAEAVRLTDSTAGYFHFFDNAKELIQPQTWFEPVVENFLSAELAEVRLNETGAWADSLRCSYPVIHNQYSEETERTGFFPGPFPVDRHMSVPIMEGDRAIGICGVVNKAMLYSTEDAKNLSVYIHNVWKIIQTRRAENALKNSEEQFKSIFENMDNGYLLNDWNGGILLVNPATVHALGYREPGELIGHKIEELVQADPREMKNLRKSLLEEEKVTNFELAFKRKDGQMMNVACNIRLIRDENGNPEKSEGVFVDITERIAVEAAFKKAKVEAEMANRAKSDFLANISHEIRTPLNAIIGMAELLKDTELTAEQREYVKIFESGGETLLTTINDVIDFSKIEAGKFELEDTEFDLVKLIETICDMLALSAHQKLLELNYEISADIPLILLGDPVRLRQVMVNLLGNAIKFTARGEVTLRCQVQSECAKEMSQEQKTGSIELLFSVADTGIGIPEEKKEMIFDRFAQVDSTTTRKYGGTGLGLPICKELLRLMDGDIWLESKVGRGTTFFFTTRFNTRPLCQLPENQEFDLENLSVLVIDDNETNRLILRKTVTTWKMRVTEAVDGQSGLAELKKAADTNTPFDLVLVDCRMPVVDGFEVARVASKDFRTQAPLVMMLTSDEKRRNPKRYKDAGIDLCLTKPVKRKELQSAIAALVSGSGQQKVVPMFPEQELLLTFKPARILLVEDYIHNRLVIESYLKDAPFQIDTAENGEVAVGKFKNNTYDLVLMDIQMPVMDGFTATRNMRKYEQLEHMRRVPIIALTAFGQGGDKEKCIQAGCDLYISKPVKKKKLLQALATYLQSALATEMEGEDSGGRSSVIEPVNREQYTVPIDAAFRDVVPGFITDVTMDTVRMFQHLEQYDFGAISKCSHSIKGAGGGYGLEHISEIAKEIELAALEKNPTQIREYLDKLSSYLEKLQPVYS